jgi:hypothetical protein
VREARLNAAEVGRYYWATRGYSWSDAATERQMHGAYSTWLAKNGHDVSEASVVSKGAGALASTKNGKAFLLSDAPTWSGSKRFQ